MSTPEEAIEPSGEANVVSTEPSALDPEVALQLVETAQAPAHFTDEYDRAVDFLEDGYVEQSLLALREYKPDSALEQIERADQLRSQYMVLLEIASVEDSHPLRDSFDTLRQFASAQRSLHAWLRSVAEALQRFRSGEYQRALQELDQPNEIAAPISNDSSITTVISVTTAATAESLAAEIRAAVGDYAGARAAFDRAASLYRQMLEVMRQDPPEQLPEFQIALCEALSKRMQLMQLLQSNDYSRAAEIANRAAAEFASAADQMVAFDPDSASLLVPLLRSSACEMLAKQAQAKAEIALEKSEWEAAEEHSRQASEYYDNGGKEALKTSLPNARIVQERLLNAGFDWGVQFGRRLEREQSAQDKYEDLQNRLDDLYASIRGALAPAGVTVNTQNELISSVQQQVEVVTKVESQARDILREIPSALGQISGLDAEKAGFAEEALEIANSSESGPSFFEKVKRFAGRLEVSLATVGAAAAPVLAILKALAIIP